MNITWSTPKPSTSFIPKLRKEAAQKSLDIAIQIWKGAVNRTPVASGELRASWNLSTNVPNFTTVGDSNSSPGRTDSILPKPTVQKIVPGPLGSTRYFISNGKSYARKVEFGTRSISPHLMLTRAVRAVDL